MMLSEDKISHLSHILLKNIIAEDIVALLEEEGSIRREIKRAIISELKIGEEIDAIVRKKLQSFSKKLIEGTPEWEVMYKKFFRDEEIRRGRASG
jgi:hypothetical protein